MFNFIFLNLIGCIPKDIPIGIILIISQKLDKNKLNKEVEE